MTNSISRTNFADKYPTFIARVDGVPYFHLSSLILSATTCSRPASMSSRISLFKSQMTGVKTATEILKGFPIPFSIHKHATFGSINDVVRFVESYKQFFPVEFIAHVEKLSRDTDFVQSMDKAAEKVIKESKNNVTTGFVPVEPEGELKNRWSGSVAHLTEEISRLKARNDELETIVNKLRQVQSGVDFFNTEKFREKAATLGLTEQKVAEIEVIARTRVNKHTLEVAKKNPSTSGYLQTGETCNIQWGAEQANKTDYARLALNVFHSLAASQVGGI